MEKQPFDLTTALEAWKQRLRQGRGVSDDNLAELESHLQDSVAELRLTGLSEEESFMIASHRLGDVGALAAELSEHKPPPISGGGIARLDAPLPGSAGKPASGCWAFSLKLFGVFLLLAGAGTLLFYGLLEKKYVGRVKMLVHAPKGSPATSNSGVLLETEFRIMTAAETFRIVVKEKELTKRWALGTDENAAIKRLEAMVEPKFERGTNLIALEVFSPNPEEAAELANAVAAAYQRRKIDYETSRLLAEMQQNTMQIKADQAMPSSTVQIHESALPNLSPVRPNLWMLMPGGIFAVLLGFISLVVGIAVNRRGAKVK